MAPGLLDLPLDTYFEIAQLLTLADLRNFSLVSSKCAQTCLDDRLWRPVVPQILCGCNKPSRDLVKLSYGIKISEEKWAGKYTKGKFNNYNPIPKFRLISGHGGKYQHYSLPTNYKLYIPVSIWQLKTLARIRLQYSKTKLDSDELKRYDKTSRLRLLTDKTIKTVKGNNFCSWEMDNFLTTINSPNINYTKFNSLEPKYGTLALFEINDYHTSAIYFRNLSKTIDELSRVLEILKLLPPPPPDSE